MNVLDSQGHTGEAESCHGVIKQGGSRFLGFKSPRRGFLGLHKEISFFGYYSELSFFFFLFFFTEKICWSIVDLQDFPGGTVLKNPPAKARDARDAGSIPGSARSPAEGSGNPLQYSCLGNPMDVEAWWAIVRGVSKSQKRLST